MDDSTKLDETDRKILRCLLAEPQISMVDLAEKVALSHTPTWRRVRRMEEEGVIAGRALLLDAERLGYPITVFAHVRIKSHDEDSLNAFEDSVQSHPQIVECFTMGGESDYLLRILARSVADYERFLKQVLLHLPGVAAMNSSFALKSVKLTTDVPV